MATAVCDTRPCDRMQVLLKTAKVKKTSDAQPTLVLIAQTSHSHGTPVEMRYCPYCGTRVAQGILSRVTER